MLISLFIFIKITYLAFPIMIIIFLNIIPITYWTRKKTEPFRGKNSFVTEEVVFNVINGELYADNIKVLNITQNKRTKEIYVDNIVISKGARYGIKTPYATLIGIDRNCTKSIFR